MELHKAIKEIVASKGADMINNILIINFLLDYQAFKEKPATKLILRDVINAGYGEAILALRNTNGWQTKFKQYEHEFIDSCGYKEELAAYVFEAIAYALGMNDGVNEEPAIKPSFNIDSFFEIPEVEAQQPANTQQNTLQHVPDPTDLYTIALSFYNEGKYQQAKGFIEKALSAQPNPAIPSNYLRLLGDILMRIGDYEGAIKCYNECFTLKAKEEQCTIDQLREAFKQHKVKGFENIMFFYYFCLYAAKRMNDFQWRQFVKGEARWGLMDAIRFCADNGINPIEDHIDIYFVDRNKLKFGDILYEDGSFAHEQSESKKAIAEIILTETTDYEKSQGWNHGYIIPFELAKRTNININNTNTNSIIYRNQDKLFMWAKITEDLPFPHSHYSIDDLNHWDEIDKIESEQFITILKYKEFPAFNAVRQYHIKMPLSNTSGWLLPSIHQITKIHMMGRRMCSSNKIFDPFEFWTSSQMDKDNAISYNLQKYRCVTYDNKNSLKGVLPIAVF